MKALPKGGFICGPIQNKYHVITNGLITVQTFDEIPFHPPIGTMLDGRFVVNGIRRLLPDGSVDPTFQGPQLIGDDGRVVRSIEISPDGKVLVGHFWNTTTQSALPGNRGLFRLNADGSTDSTFFLETAAFVRQVYILPDQKILIGGGGFRRLLPNGGNDPAFNQLGTEVEAFVVQPDGKIVITGPFTGVSGGRRPGLARLNSDGSLDFGFVPTIGNGTFLQLQSNGGILNGSPNGVYRVLPDGRTDTEWPFLRVDQRSHGLVVDSTDRVYFNDQEIVFQYSGRNRVYVPPAEIPVVLERSSTINGGWTQVQSIPANTSSDYFVTDFPGSGNTFYRTRPAQ